MFSHPVHDHDTKLGIYPFSFCHLEKCAVGTLLRGAVTSSSGLPTGDTVPLQGLLTFSDHLNKRYNQTLVVECPMVV